jgi:predicted RNA-binding protein with PIN domain
MAPAGHDVRIARRLIVDGMNVIGSRPTGWWRDRRGAMAELTEELARHAADTGDEIAVVLDSKPFDLPGGTDGIDVRFASARGPDAADDVIVDMVAADPEPSTLEVATSDRRLADRVRTLGAETISAGTLRRALDEEHD